MSEKGVGVHALVAADLSALFALYDQYDRPAAPAPEAARAEAILGAIETFGGQVLGAFDGDTLVGSVTLNICPNLSWSGRPYAVIENVIVASHHRRRGVGRALLRAATERAGALGCYKVMLLTGATDPGVQAFYLSAGFAATKQGYQLRFAHG